MHMQSLKELAGLGEVNSPCSPFTRSARTAREEDKQLTNHVFCSSLSSRLHPASFPWRRRPLALALGSKEGPETQSALGVRQRRSSSALKCIEAIDATAGASGRELPARRKRQPHHAAQGTCRCQNRGHRQATLGGTDSTHLEAAAQPKATPLPGITQCLTQPLAPARHAGAIPHLGRASSVA